MDEENFRDRTKKREKVGDKESTQNLEDTKPSTCKQANPRGS